MAKRKRPHKTVSSSRERDQTWLYGHHAVDAALRNTARKHYRILATANAAQALSDALTIANLPPEIAQAADISRCLQPGAVHQGVALHTSELPEIDLQSVCAAAQGGASRTICVLDQVTDPHNVGAILRSCAAFQATCLIVTGRNAPPASGVLAKAASGALETVPIIRAANLARTLDDLAELGFWRIGLDSETKDRIASVDMSGDTALILGAEGTGLRQLTRRKCDILCRLPTDPHFPSLNVSNAAAIALYEIARRRG